MQEEIMETMKTLKKMQEEPINSFILWDLNVQVEKMLKKLELYETPIDINRVANKLGIEDRIQNEIKLERYMEIDKHYLKNNIYLKKGGWYAQWQNSYTHKWDFYIETCYILPPFSYRYLIGYGIGVFFLNYEEESIKKHYENLYFITKFTENQCEEVCKEMALTLLMPISLVIPEIVEWRRKTGFKGSVEVLYRFLSERFVISKELVAVRCMEVSRILTEMHRFSNNEEVQKLISEYKELF